MAVTTRHCSTCGDERPFERPPCADGHGDMCPELACVDCGTAILLVGLLEPPPRRPAEQTPAESSRAA